MELSSEFFTCVEVKRGASELHGGVVYTPWLAYWWAKCPKDIGGATVITTTWGVAFMPEVGDTRPAAEMGYRKWGCLGGQA